MNSIILPKKANKSLGQNFLRDQGVAERISYDDKIPNQDIILEIGSGNGALTIPLVHSYSPKLIVCIERDKELHQIFQENLKKISYSENKEEQMRYADSRLLSYCDRNARDENCDNAANHNKVSIRHEVDVHVYCASSSCIANDSTENRDLKHISRAIQTKIILIHCDALRVDYPRLIQEISQIEKGIIPDEPSVSIFGNLPYNIATKLILLWITDNSFNLEFITAMIQKEVANRICGKPKEKVYSSLSVVSQLYADVELLFDVPPEAFFPAPKVYSSVIRMKKVARALEDECTKAQLSSGSRASDDESHITYSDNRYRSTKLSLEEAEKYSLFERFVHELFIHRRKNLRNTIVYAIDNIKRSIKIELDSREATNRIGSIVNISQRAEELSIEELYRIFKAIFQPCLRL